MDFLVSTAFGLLTVYLASESFKHRRALKKLKHRIVVSGIRGKSSLTRLIAAGLRGNGLKVMAKTTGSRAMIILPDGSESEIKRRGRANILEQKSLVHQAAASGVEFLVAEAMSIQPECLKVELQSLLQPQILVLTNFRPDHIEFLGKEREEIARSYFEIIPAGMVIFIPEEEYFPWMERLAEEKKLILVKVGPKAEADQFLEKISYPEFEVNLRLALEVLRSLGLSEEAILRGWSEVQPDYGRPRAWRVGYGCDRYINLVSLFAANDPESSLQAMEMILKRLSLNPEQVIALLSLRADRGDRTVQWAEFLQTEGSGLFNSVALIGPGARALERKLKRPFSARGQKVWCLQESQPESVLAELITLVKLNQENLGNEAVVFGLGNIAGFGQRFIDYLERTADAVRL
jgi:poly-gamma-glutamate synthase PgsB/CapB